MTVPSIPGVATGTLHWHAESTRGDGGAGLHMDFDADGEIKSVTCEPPFAAKQEISVTFKGHDADNLPMYAAIDGSILWA